MRYKQTGSDLIFAIFLAIFGMLIFAVMFYPLWFVVIASISDPIAVVSGQVTLLPIRPSLESFELVFRERNIWIGYRNSLFYLVLGTSINLIMTTLGAYPLSRPDFPFRTFFTFFIAFTMLFSGGMIPFFLLVNNLGMFDTIWAMVIPGAISTWNLLIMKNYFQSSIPMELKEAATIDGCSDLHILLRIVLPLSKPIIAVLALFYAAGHWNAFFNALIFLRNRDLFPLQIFLRNILLQNHHEVLQGELIGMLERIIRGETMKYAVIIVASVPMLILYPFAQKYFIKGVMVGALKG